MFDKDLATSLSPLSDTLSMVGPRTTWHIKNKILPPVEQSCYILAPVKNCEDDEYEALLDGTAFVKDFDVVGYEKLPYPNPFGEVLTSNKREDNTISCRKMMNYVF